MSKANQVSLHLWRERPKGVREVQTAADEEMAQHGEQKTFCRYVDVSSRKQGMSGGSVLAHVTDANDAADEEMAQQSEQKSRVQNTIEYFSVFYSSIVLKLI